MKKNKKAKNKYQPVHAKKESHSLWYWVAIGVLLFIVVASGAYFASASLFDKKPRQPRTTTDGHPPQTETLLVATDKATIMIMGVDERTDDVGRSDTLMIATVDPKVKSVSLLSVPRDTRVEVPGYGYDKINVAYSLGGHELTQETVEEFLDTPIDHYVLIKVPAFKRIIDAIGGVDIDVEKRMYYVDEWDDDGGLYIDLYPGMQHMDGATAITYVRYRDEEGDIGRVERQQKFMKAVMDQVTSPAIITRLPDIIREVMGSVETDMSFRQVMELAGAVKEAHSNGLKTDMVAGRPVYIDEISYWIPDLYETRESVASMLGISMTQRAKDELMREAGAYEASIPAGATEAPDEDTTVGRRHIRIGELRPSMGEIGGRNEEQPYGRRPRPGETVRPEDEETTRPERPEVFRPSTEPARTDDRVETGTRRPDAGGTDAVPSANETGADSRKPAEERTTSSATREPSAAQPSEGTGRETGGTRPEPPKAPEPPEPPESPARPPATPGRNTGGSTKR